MLSIKKMSKIIQRRKENTALFSQQANGGFQEVHQHGFLISVMTNIAFTRQALTSLETQTDLRSYRLSYQPLPC